MLVYKKNKSAIHLHVIPAMRCSCVFWEFTKRKLATRKDGCKTCFPLTFQSVMRRDARCLLAFTSQPPSETCNVMFSCVLTLREDISSTSCDNHISYRYDMQMYCTFVLFVNQHFPGLPASETHCTKEKQAATSHSLTLLCGVHIMNTTTKVTI
jgi:hypothetical protein